MKNREIADRLREIAEVLELGDVEYKPRAYRNAAGVAQRGYLPAEAKHADMCAEKHFSATDGPTTESAPYLSVEVWSGVVRRTISRESVAISTLTAVFCRRCPEMTVDSPIRNTSP